MWFHVYVPAFVHMCVRERVWEGTVGCGICLSLSFFFSAPLSLCKSLRFCVCYILSRLSVAVCLSLAAEGLRVRTPYLSACICSKEFRSRQATWQRTKILLGWVEVDSVNVHINSVRWDFLPPGADASQKMSVAVHVSSWFTKLVARHYRRKLLIPRSLGTDVGVHLFVWPHRHGSPWLKVHPGNTKILDSQSSNNRKEIEIDNIKVEILPKAESTKYLAQMVTFQQQETTEIKNRIRAAWASRRWGSHDLEYIVTSVESRPRELFGIDQSEMVRSFRAEVTRKISALFAFWCIYPLHAWRAIQGQSGGTNVDISIAG